MKSVASERYLNWTSKAHHESPVSRHAIHIRHKHDKHHRHISSATAHVLVDIPETNLIEEENEVPPTLKVISLTQNIDEEHLESGQSREKRNRKDGGKDGRKIKIARGRQWTLKRRLPLERFRKCAEKIIWMQRFCGTGRDNQDDSKNWKFLSWTLVYDDLGLTKRSYADLGLSFDPKEFRLKRQNHISSEAKEILCMNPDERTEEQLHTAQLSLDQAVNSFSEFPIKMQKSLVRTGWYEQFEAGRVIIRQGHTADNFYMILSGTAVVTILERSKSGEERIFTANILEKGYCFGELALIHQAKRSATVTCRDDVELLAVGREDFLDIFMKTERGKEPEHISFLRTLHLIRDWPVDEIPMNNPKICIFIYVRRDCVLCKESNKSDWIYVIMTGTCRVLKVLDDTKPTLTRTGHMTSPRSSRSRTNTPTPRKSPVQSRVPTPTSTPTPAPRQRRTGMVTLKPAHFHRTKPSIEVSTPEIDVAEEAMQAEESPRPEHQVKVEKLHDRRHPRMRQSEHKMILEAVFDEKRILPRVKHGSVNESPTVSSRRTQEDDGKQQQVFIEVAKLGPGEMFGLEQVVMSGIKDTTNCSLVSDGAECVLINRKFFRKHLSEDVAKRIRMEIQPFPTEDALQRKLQTQTNWDAYRQITVDQQLAYRKYLNKTLLKY